MENPVLYYTVLISHTLLTIFMSIGWVFNNRTVLWILFLTLVIGLFLFIINGGCFITRLEYKLGGEGYTVIDPVLHRLGINSSRQNRTYLTMMLFFCSLMITSYKLFIRDYKIPKDEDDMEDEDHVK